MPVLETWCRVCEVINDDDDNNDNAEVTGEYSARAKKIGKNVSSKANKRTHDHNKKTWLSRQLICNASSSNDAIETHAWAAIVLIGEDGYVFLRGACEKVGDISESVHWWWECVREKMQLLGKAQGIVSKRWRNLYLLAGCFNKGLKSHESTYT